MKKNIYISVDDNETRVAMVGNSVLDDLFIERKGEERLAGSIFKGVVKKVLPGMEAAFVDIGLEKDGFLYVSEILDDMGEDIEESEFPPGSIQSKLREGQEILVQVLREPIGNKGARLTAYISLPGRCTVMMPTVTQFGVSRRIKSEGERRRLKEIIKKVALPGKGFIVRTAGEGKSEKEFVADLKYQSRLWASIQKIARKSRAPKLVNEELDVLHRVVRDILNHDIAEVVIDEKASWAKLKRFARSLCPDINAAIRFYNKPSPLFEHYGIEAQIKKALSREVSLKSGGYIVIEQTEALVSIDVNTGRYTGRSRKLEDTVFRTNMEAAVEIARQLRLRDMGGIIIIDFIDMEKQYNQKKVLRELERAVKNDRAKTTILQLTDLGLVEMTRQRIRRSLSRTLFETCPYCSGSGYVKSVLTMSIESQRKLREVCASDKTRLIKVVANPRVSRHLLDESNGYIKRLQRRYRKQIVVEANPELKQDEVMFI